MYSGSADILLDDLKDELESVQHYTEMIVSVDDPMEKKLFRSVVRDEYNHAEFIMDLLKEAHIEIPEAHHQLYERAKDMVSFR